MFYVYIPVTVEYAYGKLTEYVKIPVYPRGQVPASVKKTLRSDATDDFE